MQSELLPTMIELRPNLWAARFKLMKRVNAFGVVRRARREGLLPPKGTVVETTSGSMGIGLAEVCKEDGYRCLLVTDESAFDDAIRKTLEDLGAEVVVVPKEADPRAIQSSRLKRLAELRATLTGSYWTNQYDNPLNADTYAPVAAEILKRLGSVDTLVCTVGSGASSCGIERGLREHDCDPRLVGVDIRGSVLFGLPNGERRIRGMGNGIHPANVDHTSYDEVHWLSDAAVIAATRRLRSTYGVDVGPTSGAAFLVAEWKHRFAPSKIVCTVFPDAGDRYRTTSGDPAWVHANGLHLDRAPVEPVEENNVPLSTPSAHWTMFHWNRRPFRDVTGRAWRGSARSGA